MTVSKVSDLTSAHVGRRYRVQTEDGAFVEGKIIRIMHTLPLRSSSVVQTIIQFDELYILDEKRQRVHFNFTTFGNRDAHEVEE